jgi:MFS family permease
MVNDLYFLHERGWYMGIYMNSISGGNTIGPLICGFVVESIGWRWHKWMAVIFTGINFLAVLLFVPETQFNRDISKSLGSEISTGTVQVCYSPRISAERFLCKAGQNNLPQLCKRKFFLLLSLCGYSSSLARKTHQEIITIYQSLSIPY